MLITEEIGILTQVDDEGNEHRLFPMSKSVVRTTGRTLDHSYPSKLKLNKIYAKSEQIIGKGNQLLDVNTAEYEAPFYKTDGELKENLVDLYVAKVACQKSTVYSISIDQRLTVGNEHLLEYGGVVMVNALDENETFIERLVNLTSDVRNASFITPIECAWLQVVHGDSVKSVMLNAGDEVLPWEPFTNGTVSPNVLYPARVDYIKGGSDLVIRSYNVVTDFKAAGFTSTEDFIGIPVSSGGNYVDDNGQEWLCDEFDFEHGKYIQNVRRVVVNSFNYVYVRTDGDTSILKVMLTGYPGKTDVDVMSSHFNNCIMAGDNMSILFGIRMSDIPGVSNYSDLQTWINGQDIEFFYPLKNPIERDLTLADIQKSGSLMSYDETTNVSLSVMGSSYKGAFIDLTYATNEEGKMLIEQSLYYQENRRSLNDLILAVDDLNDKVADVLAKTNNNTEELNVIKDDLTDIVNRIADVEAIANDYTTNGIVKSDFVYDEATETLTINMDE